MKPFLPRPRNSNWTGITCSIATIVVLLVLASTWSGLSGHGSLRRSSRPQAPPRPHSALLPRQPRVAVSLIVMESTMWLHPMLESLADSDIIQAAGKVTLFVFCNSPNTTSPATLLMRDYNRLPVVHVPNARGVNEGIVVARIRVMEAILAASPAYHAVLEVHDDMLFPTHWFSDLLSHDAPHVGLLSPFIFNGCLHPTCFHSDAMTRYRLPPSAPADVTLYDDCLQVHPWLVKRALIDSVGYYDAAFSPHEHEDDDFVLRLRAAGWTMRAVRSSWVLHLGTGSRFQFLPRTDGGKNVRLFYSKHGMNASQAQAQWLTPHCHPVLGGDSRAHFDSRGVTMS